MTDFHLVSSEVKALSVIFDEVLPTLLSVNEETGDVDLQQGGFTVKRFFLSRLFCVSGTAFSTRAQRSCSAWRSL